MYKAIMNNGFIFESLNVKSLWYTVHHHRRYDVGEGYGLTGGILYAPNGHKIYEWIDGNKIPLEDTGISVRAYNGIKRQAEKLGMDWEHLTTGDVFQMAKRGDLRRIPYLKTTTMNEILRMLWNTCGFDPIVTFQLS